MTDETTLWTTLEAAGYAPARGKRGIEVGPVRLAIWTEGIEVRVKGKKKVVPLAEVVQAVTELLVFDRPRRIEVDLAFWFKKGYHLQVRYRDRIGSWCWG